MRKFAVALGVSLLIVASLSAQKQKNQSHYDAFVAGTPNQATLVKNIRHALIMLPYYTIFDDLGFRVNGSTVTLVGDVTNPVLKSDAENVVKHIEGVTNVINEIHVLPVSPMDWQIRRAEYRAIYGDPAIWDRYCCHAIPPIHIIVENGHVRLEGVVQNQFDKNLIGVRANSVPNVFSVENDLQVENG